MVMVECAVDFLLDGGKVADHAVGSQLLRTTKDGDNPVMTVNISTFAFV
jgi:hypothetical protein